MRRSIVLAALALATVAAPPAGAATGSFEIGRLAGSTDPSETIPVLAGPRPVGDLVAFATGTAARGWSLRLGGPGVAQREVSTVAPEPGSSLRLLASPTRLVAERHASLCLGCGKGVDPTVTLDAVMSGPLAGPLATVAQCRPAAGGCAPPDCHVSQGRYRASLDGDLLALRDGCTATAELRDLAGGVTRSLGPATAVAVAGGLVAVAEPRAGGAAAVVVRDAATGSELYRAAIPTDSVHLALLSDGTSVYSAGASGRQVLVAATPSAPAGRVLRAIVPGTLIAGTATGVVLLTTPVRHDAPARHLELVRVDGGPSPAAGLDLDELAGEVAFDGRTLAWAQRRCVTTVVMGWRVGDPAPARPDLRCSAAVPSRAPVTLPRSRRLGVVLACPAGRGRGGCLSSVRLTAVRRGRLPPGANGAERLWALGRTGAALNPGERAAAELVVTRAAARWMRRHAPVRLRIEVRTSSTSPSLVRRTVTLRFAR